MGAVFDILWRAAVIAAEGVSRRKSVYLSGKGDRVIKAYFSEIKQLCLTLFFIWGDF